MVVTGWRPFLAEIVAFHALCSTVHASYYALLVRVIEIDETRSTSVTDPILAYSYAPNHYH
jgi:hypothetical protein